MKTCFARLMLSLTCLLFVVTVRPAMAAPAKVSLTARIADANGPVSGNVDLSFKMFDALSEGALIWEETHAQVHADDGLVFVELGSIDPGSNALDASVFDGEELYLEIAVNGAAQSPRIPILSVPYAVRASMADSLGPLGPGDVALSNHLHDDVYAALDHDHDGTYAAADHNHDGVYAAADHNHDGVYALQSHSHAAEDITSGSLALDRFSAYADLGDEGYLDNTDDGDLLTRTQLDGRYLGKSGGTLTGPLVLSGSNDITADQFKFGSSKTFYYAISALTLVGEGIVRHAGSGESYLMTDTTQAWVEAPVHLPHGAVITSFSCRLKDNDAGHINVGIHRHQTQVENTICGLTTNGLPANASYQTLSCDSLSYTTVDNLNYAYYMGVYLTGSQNTTDLSINRCTIGYMVNEVSY